MQTQNGGGSRALEAAPHTQPRNELSGVNSSRSGDDIVSSQQVRWWSAHLYVVPTLVQVGSWPMIGTPAWCRLTDDDPTKLAAALDAAQHWALRVETCQAAQCEASREISAADDWADIGRNIRWRNEFYAQRPWLKRVTA